MPVPLQLDRHPLRQQLARKSWDARVADMAALAGRRTLFWMIRHIWPLSLAAVLLWLGWMVQSWYQRGGMPLP